MLLCCSRELKSARGSNNRVSFGDISSIEQLVTRRGRRGRRGRGGGEQGQVEDINSSNVSSNSPAARRGSRRGRGMRGRALVGSRTSRNEDELVLSSLPMSAQVCRLK